MLPIAGKACDRGIAAAQEADQLYDCTALAFPSDIRVLRTAENAAAYQQRKSRTILFIELLHHTLGSRHIQFVLRVIRPAVLLKICKHTKF